MQRDPKPYRILVVEDNPGDLLLVEDYLEETMVAPAVLKAGNFGEAVDVLRHSQRQMDVVLLDLTLPDLQGEDLIMKMIELAGETPIIILTGFTDFSFATHSLAMGASDYLLKDSLSSAMLYKSIVYNIERNKHLLRLKESEQRYSNLFQLSPQPMWVYDLETLRFLDVNEAAVNHYGYSYDEFLSMTLTTIRPPAEIPKMERGVERVREREKFYSHGQYLHKKKSGEEIMVEIRSNIIRYNGKKAEVVLATDITERYKHIQAIEEQNKRLREIAWTQSHVVRAPLARIMGLVQIFENRTTTTTEKEEILQYVINSAVELDNTIQDIVNKSQQTRIKI